MTEPATTPSTSGESIAALRESLTAVKREAAKVLAQMQLGGDRRTRRDLVRQLEACRRHGRQLMRTVDALREDETLEEAGRDQVEQAARFLTQLQEFQSL